MSKRIPLTRGLFAIVDDSDFEQVNRFKWYAKKSTNTFYAMHSRPLWERFVKPKEIRMHCFILNTPHGVEVDHKNRNGLDNRRKNLRVCNHSQNMINRPLHKRNTSGYRGVDWDKVHKKWQARITKDKYSKYLGLYSNIIDAARAYDKAARELHGEFATLNFPDE